MGSPRYDIVSGVQAVNAFSVANITSSTTTHGAILDMQNAYSAMCTFKLGTVTDGTYTILVEEGNDSGLSDAATVAAANLIKPDPAGAVLSTSNQVLRIGYAKGNFRYVRFSIVSAGVTSGVTNVLALAHLGTQRQQPV